MRHPLASRALWVPNDFDLPSHLLLDPLASLPGVALVHPYFSHAGKHAFDRLQQELHAFPILKIGRMDGCLEDQARRIDEEMSLAA